MKKLKIVKKKFKNNNNLKKYKKIFLHRQTRFFISKIALLFLEDVEIKVLYDWEISFLNKKIDKNMFKDVFNDFKKYKKNVDWDSFAIVIWYIYQISRYYKDKKNKTKNDYLIKGIIECNKEKRFFYNKWLKTLDKENKNFNDKIIKLNKIIL